MADAVEFRCDRSHETIVDVAGIALIVAYPSIPKVARVGPTFVFPTATSKSAGQGAWQAGPALGGIYTGIPGLLIGFVAQNRISFAYTSPKRPPQNTLEFQPVFALHLWGKWYLRSADANWTMGWHRHSPTMLTGSGSAYHKISFRVLADRATIMPGISTVIASNAKK